MLKTSMLIQEESRIFDELLSRFEALSEEQMQVVGVTWEWSTKDLLGHLAHWEQGATEQVRELQAGTWSPRKRTLEEAEQINQEVTAANHATLVPQLREHSAAPGQKSYRLCKRLRWRRMGSIRSP